MTTDSPAAAADDDDDDLLVQRHYPWVRAAAMRRVRDAHVADDVAQAVFIVLMRKKPAFGSDAALSAWLFQTMRYAAAHALRSQRRRTYHEARAAAEIGLKTSSSLSSTDEWQEIAPLLDESVARLRQDDREAVLLRFYQQKTFGDVGAAMGISEEAARKRVDRAVDKLRDAFTRRGVTVPTATALASTLMTHATPTLPVAPLITTAAGATAAAGQLAKGIAMTWTPAKIAAVTIAALLVLPAVATVGYLALGTSAPPAAQPAQPAQPAEQANAISQVDPIIPDDLLSVAISDLVGPGMETVARCRVDPDSNITLPLVGALNLNKMTLNEAELAAQKAYRDHNLIAKAQISIRRVESGKAPSIRWARVGVGDFLRVEILDLVGPGVMTTITHRVGDNGLLALPQAGSIKVLGLSEVELERAIQEQYRRKNLMAMAQVHAERITEQQAKGQPEMVTRSARQTAPN